MSDPGATALLPDPSQLRLLCIGGLDAEPAGLVLTVAAKARAARCPGCGGRSGRVHSRYTRTVKDLPWAELPVRLRLQARRFFCDAPACPQRIFTERLPGVVAPYARCTDRLAAWLTRVAFALGGAPGARLLGHQRRPRSGDTLLRRIRWLQLRDPSLLKEEERPDLQRMLAADSVSAHAYDLVQQCRDLSSVPETRLASRSGCQPHSGAEWAAAVRYLGGRAAQRRRRRPQCVLQPLEHGPQSRAPSRE